MASLTIEASLSTREMLETFAAVGAPADAARIVLDRVGGVVDSVVLSPSTPPDALAAQMAVLRSVGS